MTTPYRPQLHSQADLEEAWRHLIRPLGFHRRSVWLMLIDAEGRPTPVVTEVTDLPEVVDLETTQGLGEMLAHEVVHLANDESITPIPLDEVTDYLQAS